MPAVTPVVVASEAQSLFLGQPKIFLGQSIVQVAKPLDRVGDGSPIGHHPAEPAVGDEKLAAAARLFRHRFLGLTLGTDEKQSAAGGTEVEDELGGFAEAPQRLLEIDDVDAVSLAEDVAPHLRVPPPSLVTEMDTRLEHLAHTDVRHGSYSSWG